MTDQELKNRIRNMYEELSKKESPPSFHHMISAAKARNEKKRSLNWFFLGAPALLASFLLVIFVIKTNYLQPTSEKIANQEAHEAITNDEVYEFKPSSPLMAQFYSTVEWKNFTDDLTNQLPGSDYLNEIPSYNLKFIESGVL